MAQKRMFDKGIIETDAFMDMPMPTKALYFLLGMEADDEGFVSPKRVMRIYGGNDDDIKVLITKNFVIQFDSGVVVITDWKENNYLDKNRIKETKYQAEKKLLSLSTNNKYMRLNRCLTGVQPEESSIEEYRIEEDTMSADADLSFEEFWKNYPKKELKKKSLEIWKRKKFGTQLQVILDFIKKAKETDRWQKGYVKQPPAFLNGECWNDDLSSYNDKKQVQLQGLNLLKK